MSNIWVNRHELSSARLLHVKHAYFKTFTLVLCLLNFCSVCIQFEPDLTNRTEWERPLYLRKNQSVPANEAASEMHI